MSIPESANGNPCVIAQGHVVQLCIEIHQGKSKQKNPMSYVSTFLNSCVLRQWSCSEGYNLIGQLPCVNAMRKELNDKKNISGMLERSASQKNVKIIL